MTLYFDKDELNAAESLDFMTRSNDRIAEIEFGGDSEDHIYNLKKDQLQDDYEQSSFVKPLLEQPRATPTRDRWATDQPQDEWNPSTMPASAIGLVEPEQTLWERPSAQFSEANYDIGGGSNPAAPGEVEAYIREAARKRGIDPDVAVGVAKSEGGVDDPVRPGDNGSSFGPFQLHMAGLAGGGNAVGGLGDTALQHGIDPRNPAHWRQAIDFSLDQAAQSGWGPWHGAARVGIGNSQGLEAAKPIGFGGQETDDDTAWRGGIHDPNTQQRTPGSGMGVKQEQESGPDGVLNRPSQFGVGLSAADANAACGPVLAMAFANKYGRYPSAQEAVDLAKQFGWTADQGMAGVDSQVNLMQALGVPAAKGPVDWDKIAQDVQSGNPVGIDTAGHYFAVQGYDPETGRFDFGTSVTDLRASGGRRWFKPEEIAGLGFGAPRTAIYVDNPGSPSPSFATVAARRGRDVDKSITIEDLTDDEVSNSPPPMTMPPAQQQTLRDLGFAGLDFNLSRYSDATKRQGYMGEILGDAHDDMLKATGADSPEVTGNYGTRSSKYDGDIGNQEIVGSNDPNEPATIRMNPKKLVSETISDFADATGHSPTSDDALREGARALTGVMAHEVGHNSVMEHGDRLDNLQHLILDEAGKPSEDRAYTFLAQLRDDGFLGDWLDQSNQKSKGWSGRGDDWPTRPGESPAEPETPSIQFNEANADIGGGDLQAPQLVGPSYDQDNPDQPSGLNRVPEVSETPTQFPQTPPRPLYEDQPDADVSQGRAIDQPGVQGVSNRILDAGPNEPGFTENEDIGGQSGMSLAKTGVETLVGGAAKVWDDQNKEARIDYEIKTAVLEHTPKTHKITEPLTIEEKREIASYMSPEAAAKYLGEHFAQEYQKPPSELDSIPVEVFNANTKEERAAAIAKTGWKPKTEVDEKNPWARMAKGVGSNVAGLFAQLGSAIDSFGANGDAASSRPIRDFGQMIYKVASEKAAENTDLELERRKYGLDRAEQEGGQLGVLKKLWDAAQDPDGRFYVAQEVLPSVVQNAAEFIAGALLIRSGNLGTLGKVAVAEPAINVFMQESGQAYQEARLSGVDPKSASNIATVVGAINSYIEFLPWEKMLPGGKDAAKVAVRLADGTIVGAKEALAKRMFNVAKEIGIDALTEGSEEVLQAFAGNLAQRTYDPNADLSKGMAAGFVYGALGGGVGSATMGMVGRGKSDTTVADLVDAPARPGIEAPTPSLAGERVVEGQSRPVDVATPGESAETQMRVIDQQGRPVDDTDQGPTQAPTAPSIYQNVPTEKLQKQLAIYDARSDDEPLSHDQLTAYNNVAQELQTRQAALPAPTEAQPEEAWTAVHQEQGGEVPGTGPQGTQRLGGLAMPEHQAAEGTPERAVEDLARKSAASSPDGLAHVKAEEIQPLLDATQPRATHKLGASNLDGYRKLVESSLKHKDWYESVGDIAPPIVGDENVPEFYAVSALLSPQTKWPLNLEGTIRVMAGVRRAAMNNPDGKLKRSDLDAIKAPGMAWSNKRTKDVIFKLYQDGVVVQKSGVKVPIFNSNFKSAADRTSNLFPTMDVWMGRAFKLPAGGTADQVITTNLKANRIAQEVFRWIAREKGITPQQSQAAAWVAMQLFDAHASNLYQDWHSGKITLEDALQKAMDTPGVFDTFQTQEGGYDASAVNLPAVRRAIEEAGTAIQQPGPDRASEARVETLGGGQLSLNQGIINEGIDTAQAGAPGAFIPAQIPRERLQEAGLRQNNTMPWITAPHRVVQSESGTYLTLPSGNVDTAEYYGALLGQELGSHQVVIHVVDPRGEADAGWRLQTSDRGVMLKGDQVEAFKRALTDAGVTFVSSQTGNIVQIPNLNDDDALLDTIKQAAWDAGIDEQAITARLGGYHGESRTLDSGSYARVVEELDPTFGARRRSDLPAGSRSLLPDAGATGPGTNTLPGGVQGQQRRAVSVKRQAPRKNPSPNFGDSRIRALHAQGLSDTDIAKRLPSDISTVTKARKRLGLSANNPRNVAHSDEVRERALRALSNKQATVANVAANQGIPKSTLEKWVRAEGGLAAVRTSYTVAHQEQGQQTTADPRTYVARLGAAADQVQGLRQGSTLQSVEQVYPEFVEALAQSGVNPISIAAGRGVVGQGMWDQGYTKPDPKAEQKAVAERQPIGSERDLDLIVEGTKQQIEWLAASIGQSGNQSEVFVSYESVDGDIPAVTISLGNVEETPEFLNALNMAADQSKGGLGGWHLAYDPGGRAIEIHSAARFADGDARARLNDLQSRVRRVRTILESHGFQPDFPAYSLHDIVSFGQGDYDAIVERGPGQAGTGTPAGSQRTADAGGPSSILNERDRRRNPPAAGQERRSEPGQGQAALEGPVKRGPGYDLDPDWASTVQQALNEGFPGFDESTVEDIVSTRGTRNAGRGYIDRDGQVWSVESHGGAATPLLGMLLDYEAKSGQDAINQMTNKAGLVRVSTEANVFNVEVGAPITAQQAATLGRLSQAMGRDVDQAFEIHGANNGALYTSWSDFRRAVPRDKEGTAHQIQGEGRAAIGLSPDFFRKEINSRYTGDRGMIAIKEMVQNSVDASRPKEGRQDVRRRQVPRPGRQATIPFVPTTTIRVDQPDRTIRVTDQGIGMTPSIVQNEFTKLGGSSKPGGASGGFGTAKVAVLGNADQILLRTIARQFDVTTTDGEVLASFPTREQADDWARQHPERFGAAPVADVFNDPEIFTAQIRNALPLSGLSRENHQTISELLDKMSDNEDSWTYENFRKALSNAREDISFGLTQAMIRGSDAFGWGSQKAGYENINEIEYWIDGVFDTLGNQVQAPEHDVLDKGLVETLAYGSGDEYLDPGKGVRYIYGKPGTLRDSEIGRFFPSAFFTQWNGSNIDDRYDISQSGDGTWRIVDNSNGGVLGENLNSDLDAIDLALQNDVPTGTMIQVKIRDDAKWDTGSSYAPAVAWMKEFGNQSKLRGQRVAFELDGGQFADARPLNDPLRSDSGSWTPSKLIQTIELPEASLDFYAADAQTEQEYITYSILNEGMPQLTSEYVQLPSSAKVPVKMSVDVRSKVKAGDNGYPWSVDRMRVTEGVQQTIKDFMVKDLAAAAIREERETLRRAIQSGRKIVPGMYLVESTGSMRPEIVDTFAEGAYMKPLARAIKEVFERLSKDVTLQSVGTPGGQRPAEASKMIGFGTSRGWLGLSVNADLVDGEHIGLLLNPWGLWNEASQRARAFGERGYLLPEDMPQQAEEFKRSLRGTLVHEWVHNYVRAHNEDFAGALTRVFPRITDKTFAPIDKTIDRMLREVGPLVDLSNHTDLWESNAGETNIFEKGSVDERRTAPGVPGQSAGSTATGQRGRDQGLPQGGQEAGRGPASDLRRGAREQPEGTDLRRRDVREVAHQVQREVARTLPGEVAIPDSDELRQAVANTPGAVIDADGLTVDVVRHQKWEQDSSPSIRSGVMYLARANKSREKNYRTNENTRNAEASHGGPMRIEGPTTFRRPLVIRGGMGGSTFEKAFNQLWNTQDGKALLDRRQDIKRAREQEAEARRAFLASKKKDDNPSMTIKLSNRWEAARRNLQQIIATPSQRLDVDLGGVVTFWGGRQKGDSQEAQVSRLGAILEAWGVDDGTARSKAAAIVGLANKGNQLRYAAKELITAYAARHQGYDSIIQISRGFNSRPTIGEVFDLREATYPDQYGVTELHDEYGGGFSQNTAAHADQVDPFYSQLERTISEKLPNRVSVDQLQATLRNSPVKEDEIKWTGLDEFIEQAKRDKRPITKQEVMDHLRENAVRVEEVTKTSGAKRSITADQVHVDSYPQEDSVDEAGDFTRWTVVAGDYNFNVEQEPDGTYSVLEDGVYHSPDYVDTWAEMEALVRDIASDNYEEGGSLNDPENVQYQFLTLPGGEDYTELLLILPKPDDRKKLDTLLSEKRLIVTSGQYVPESLQKQIDTLMKRMGDQVNARSYQGSHWSEENVLAHVRFDTRIEPTYDLATIDDIGSRLVRWYSEQQGRPVDALSFGSGITSAGVEAGVITPLEAAQYIHARRFRDDGTGATQRVLFVQEIQSDWHQEGRKYGYRGPSITSDLPPGWTMVERESKYTPGVMGWSVLNENGREQIWAEDSLQAQLGGLEAYNRNQRGKPPKAPFSKTWHELALKRMLRYAAENGYDVLALPTGEIAARVEGGGDPGNMTREQREGLSGFYDKILRGAAQKLVKKWGAAVGTTRLSIAGKAGAWPARTALQDIADDMTDNGSVSAEIADQARTLVSTKRQPDEWSALDWLEENGVYSKDSIDAVRNELRNLTTGTVETYAIPINERMRESVMTEGQPLFRSGRRVKPTFDSDSRLIAEIQANNGEDIGSEAAFYSPNEELDPDLMREIATADYNRRLARAVRKIDNYLKSRLEGQMFEGERIGLGRFIGLAAQPGWVGISIRMGRQGRGWMLNPVAMVADLRAMGVTREQMPMRLQAHLLATIAHEYGHHGVEIEDKIEGAGPHSDLVNAIINQFGDEILAPIQELVEAMDRAGDIDTLHGHAARWQQEVDRREAERERNNAPTGLQQPAVQRNEPLSSPVRPRAGPDNQGQRIRPEADVRGTAADTSRLPDVRRDDGQPGLEPARAESGEPRPAYLDVLERFPQTTPAFYAQGRSPSVWIAPDGRMFSVSSHNSSAEDMMQAMGVEYDPVRAQSEMTKHGLVRLTWGRGGYGGAEIRTPLTFQQAQTLGRVALDKGLASFSIEAIKPEGDGMAFYRSWREANMHLPRGYASHMEQSGDEYGPETSLDQDANGNSLTADASATYRRDGYPDTWDFTQHLAEFARISDTRSDLYTAMASWRSRKLRETNTNRIPMPDFIGPIESGRGVSDRVREALAEDAALSDAFNRHQDTWQNTPPAYRIYPRAGDIAGGTLQISGAASGETVSPAQALALAFLSEHAEPNGTSADELQAARQSLEDEIDGATFDDGTDDTYGRTDVADRVHDALTAYFDAVGISPEYDDVLNEELKPILARSFKQFKAGGDFEAGDFADDVQEAVFRSGLRDSGWRRVIWPGGSYDLHAPMTRSQIDLEGQERALDDRAASQDDRELREALGSYTVDRTGFEPDVLPQFMGAEQIDTLHQRLDDIGYTTAGVTTFGQAALDRQRADLHAVVGDIQRMREGMTPGEYLSLAYKANDIARALDGDTADEDTVETSRRMAAVEGPGYTDDPTVLGVLLDALERSDGMMVLHQKEWQDAAEFAFEDGLAPPVDTRAFQDNLERTLLDTERTPSVARGVADYIVRQDPDQQDEQDDWTVAHQQQWQGGFVPNQIRQATARPPRPPKTPKTPRQTTSPTSHPAGWSDILEQIRLPGMLSSAHQIINQFIGNLAMVPPILTVKWLEQTGGAIRSGNVAELAANLTMLNEWMALGHGMSTFGQNIFAVLMDRPRPYQVGPGGVPYNPRDLTNPTNQVKRFFWQSSRILAAPSRVLTEASDILFWVPWQHLSLRRQASAMARKSNLRGAKWWAEVNKMTANPTQEMLDEASAFADRMTLKNALTRREKVIPGKGNAKPYVKKERTLLGQGESLRDLRVHGFNVGKYLVPFARAIGNSFARGIDMTPIGLVGTLLDMTRASMGYGPYAAKGMQAKPFGQSYEEATLPLDERLALNAFGIGVMMAAAGLVRAGLLTGSGPDDDKQKRDLLATGWKPDSFKIPGWPNYIPLRILGPLAIPLGATANWIEQSQMYGKAGDTRDAQMLRALSGWKNVFANNTYMGDLYTYLSIATQSGPNSIVSALREASFITSGLISSQLIPSSGMMRSIARGEDEYQRESDRITQPDLGEFVEATKSSLMQGIPRFRPDLPIKQDLLGRPVRNPNRGLAALLPPMSEEAPSPLIDALRQADVGLSRAPKELSTGQSGIKVSMTKDEQREWQQLYGQSLQEAWNRAKNTTDPSVLKAINTQVSQQTTSAMLTTLYRRLGKDGYMQRIQRE